MCCGFCSCWWISTIIMMSYGSLIDQLFSTITRWCWHGPKKRQQDILRHTKPLRTSHRIWFENALWMTFMHKWRMLWRMYAAWTRRMCLLYYHLLARCTGSQAQAQTNSPCALDLENKKSNGYNKHYHSLLLLIQKKRNNTFILYIHIHCNGKDGISGGIQWGLRRMDWAAA